MGGLKDVVGPVAGAVVGAITQGGPRRQYKWNKKAAEDANAMNRANAEWQLEQNRRLLEEQRLYDSPEQQMARYKAAGLNPNLIYGSAGSSSAPIQVGNMAPSRLDAPDASYPDVAGRFISASQSLAQMGLASARTIESEMKQQALAIQNEISKTNPMLNPQVASSVADAMTAVADSKTEEWRYLWGKNYDKGNGEYYQRGAQKIQAELDAMFQRLGLNTADLQIKNRILESKDFENALKELQVKWMEDADVTPEHIRQGLMLLLGKMLGR